MATLQDALAKAKQRVSQQVDKKKVALDDLEKYKELETEIMQDISLPADLRKEFTEYLKNQSALEIWDIHPDAKKLDKSDLLKWKKSQVVPSEPLTEGQVAEVKYLYEAVKKRKEKLADNFDISIIRAKKEQLLIELMIDTADKAIKSEFHAEYEKELCKDPEEKKKEKKEKYPDLPVPTDGMTLDELLEVCGTYGNSKGEPDAEWKFAGLVMSKHQLTPGAGGVLVPKAN